MGEDSTLYFVYATYNTTYTDYLMFYVYYSSDEGDTWSYLGGAYNSSRDILYPDIDVTDDRIIVSDSDVVVAEGESYLKSFRGKKGLRYTNTECEQFRIRQIKEYEKELLYISYLWFCNRRFQHLYS